MQESSDSVFARLAVLGLSLAAWGLASAPANADEPKMIIGFKTLYGVDGPFVDNDVIRGVVGDELPWKVEKARGSLDSDGHLSVKVKGLVFTDDPSVPPELQGINDEETFRALVSCLTEEGDAVIVRNVVTVPFPATPEGDSQIKTTLELPNPCVAPIVFVLSGSEDKWFAVTGHEQEQERGQEQDED